MASLTPTMGTDQLQTPQTGAPASAGQTQSSPVVARVVGLPADEHGDAHWDVDWVASEPKETTNGLEACLRCRCLNTSWWAIIALLAVLIGAGAWTGHEVYRAALATSDDNKARRVSEECGAVQRTLVSALLTLAEHGEAFAAVIHQFETAQDGSADAAPVYLSQARQGIRSWVAGRRSSKISDVRQYIWFAETDSQQQWSAVEAAAQRTYGAPRPISYVNGAFFQGNASEPFERPWDGMPGPRPAVVYPILVYVDGCGVDAPAPDRRRPDWANVDVNTMKNVGRVSQFETQRVVEHLAAFNAQILSKPILSVTNGRRGLWLAVPCTGPLRTVEDGLIAGRRTFSGIHYEYEADFLHAFSTFPDHSGFRVAMIGSDFDAFDGIVSRRLGDAKEDGDFARQLIGGMHNKATSSGDGDYEVLFTYMPPSGIDTEFIAHESFHLLNATFFVACALSDKLSSNEDTDVAMLLAVLVAVIFTIVIAAIATYTYLYSLLSKVKQLNDNKRTFISFICHEVRNPLHTIMGLGNMLVDECEVVETSRHQFKGTMSAIDASCMLMRKVLDDVLEYSLLDRVDQEFRPVSRPFSMFEFLNRLYVAFGQRCAAEQLSFTLNLVGALPETVIGDSVRLQQVCVNLLSNACKYTLAGSVTFRVSCVETPEQLRWALQSPASRVGGQRRLSKQAKMLLKTPPGVSRTVPGGGRGGPSSSIDGSGDGVPLLKAEGAGAGAGPPPMACRIWTFEVEDTGLGIAAEDVTNIFQAYIASSSRLEKDMGGTGLGLPTCVKLVHALGGTMGVRSQRGKGSVFWFKVPLDCGGPDPAGTDVPVFVTADAFANPGQLLSPSGRGNERMMAAALAGSDAALQRVDADLAAACPDLSPNNSRFVDDGQTRLLYCEDSAVNRKLLGRMLRNVPDIHVEYAENGLEGVVKFKRQNGLGADPKLRYDIILMDLNMPVLGGLDATREIRQFERDEGILLEGDGRVMIVACTAQVGIDAERKLCLASGMDALLSKPFSKKELMDILETVPTRMGMGGSSGDHSGHNTSCHVSRSALSVKGPSSTMTGFKSAILQPQRQRYASYPSRPSGSEQSPVRQSRHLSHEAAAVEAVAVSVVASPRPHVI